MATDDDTKKLWDRFAALSDSYRAFALLAHSELGSSHPVTVLLDELNGCLQRACDDLNARGMLS